MKSLKNATNKIVLFVTAMLLNIYAFAQEEGTKLDVNVTKSSTTTTTWYTEPWVWIVGVGVFILLFAAILRGSGAGRRSDA